MREKERILCVFNRKKKDRRPSVRFISGTVLLRDVKLFFFSVFLCFSSAGMRGKTRERDWKVADEAEESQHNLHSYNEK